MDAMSPAQSLKLAASRAKAQENEIEEFSLNVVKAYFRFNAAHFIAYKGFREKLHGHNYQVGVRLIGSDSVNDDGYVMDFGEIKAVVKSICKSWNELFLLPLKSDVLVIEEVGEDGAVFLFPKGDCNPLPIVHSSVEELARYIHRQLVAKVSLARLQERRIKRLEVTVAEAPGQSATYTKTLGSK